MCLLISVLIGLIVIITVISNSKLLPQELAGGV